MNFINYIISNADEILVVALAFAVVAAVIYLIVKNKLAEVLYALITSEEVKNPDGTGEYKFAQVLSKLYSYLPKWLTIILPGKTVASWIENALKLARERWAENGIIEKLEGKEYDAYQTD